MRGNVYMLVGAGANITVSVGREGVLLVDSGEMAMADKVVATITYDQNAQTFDSEVSQLKDAGADGIVVVGFNESARILALMVQKGIGPANVKVYGTDGNMGNTLGSDFEAGTISK